MKNIAVVLTKIGPKKKILIDYLNSKFENKIKATPVKIDDVSIMISNDEIKIRRENENLEKFDLVYFRRVGDKNLSIVNLISNYLEKKGTRFIDKSLLTIGKGEDKLTNSYILADMKVPIVRTIYSKKWEEITSFVSLPFIAKDIDKQRTEGVFMIKTKEDFEKLSTEFPDSRFLYQKFMQIDKEYRLLVMGNKVRTVLVKDTRIYDFKVTTPHGIAEEYLDPNEISEELKEIAVKSASALNLDIGGVDLMIEKGTDKPFIIEVNRGPGITVEYDKSPELPQLADYFKSELA